MAYCFHAQNREIHEKHICLLITYCFYGNTLDYTHLLGHAYKRGFLLF